jgi:hypothetical protein
MPLTRWTIAAILCLAGIVLSHSAGGADTEKQAPSDDLAWIEKRVQEWQPTKDERRFDDIGWARDIRQAKKLAKEHQRPVFLFTMKGHVAEGRC